MGGLLHRPAVLLSGWLPLLPAHSYLPTSWRERHCRQPLPRAKDMQPLCPSPERQMYLSLHRLCPGGGDAERSACTPHGGHSPLGPGPLWAHLAGARSNILLHLPRSGRAGGRGGRQRAWIRIWFPAGPCSVFMISFSLSSWLYVAISSLTS